MAQSSWTIGHNVRIDTHWATTNSAEIRRHGGIGRARTGRRPPMAPRSIGEESKPAQVRADYCICVLLGGVPS